MVSTLGQIAHAGRSVGLIRFPELWFMSRSDTFLQMGKEESIAGRRANYVFHGKDDLGVACMVGRSYPFAGFYCSRR